MTGGRSLTRWFIVVALASLSAFGGEPGAGAAQPGERVAIPGDLAGGSALGVVRADASARLNNLPVAPGAAVFMGDVIETSQTSGAVVSFRNGDSAILSESGEVALEWESSPTSLNLRRGVLVVQGATGSLRPTSIHILGATVIAHSDGPQGEFPAICRIAALERGAAISNVHGRVEIYGEGEPFVLPVGKSVHLEAHPSGAAAAGPQAAGTPAGKVSRKMPEATVQHSGQPSSTVLKIQDTIYWDDLIQTVQNGRVQVQLTDGSTLNVGARSQLRVTKHDVGSGQTALELTVGKVRADVVKITKPGGSFQVKTQTAVIGVVGTRFIVQAAINNTHVICLEGEVTVSSINAAIAGTAVLHAGQMTNVPRGGPPGGAMQAPSGQVNSEISQTNIGGGIGGLGGANGLGAVSKTGNILNAGTAGVSAGASAASGVAIARVHSATHSLADTLNTLSFAASESNSATASANSANAASNSAGTAVNGINQALLSPTTPCGCQ